MDRSGAIPARVMYMGPCWQKVAPIRHSVLMPPKTARTLRASLLRLMTGLRDIAPPSSGGKEVTADFDSRDNVKRLQCKSVFCRGTCKVPAKENDNRVYAQAPSCKC